MSLSGYRKQIKDPFIIGIDLGTTNSLVSFMKNNTPTLINDKNGKSTIPSVVKLGDPDIIGIEAKPFLVSDPLNTIFASKRLIGRKFKDTKIQDYLKILPYKTTSSCNGDVWIKCDTGKLSPVQIGAKILKKLKNMAQNHLGAPIERAVVTVPAYFDDTQRQATKDAGRIAGLDVVRVINEPTAAALAYGLDKNAQGNVAVYDLGGGTFDISILELENGIFQVKSTNGDTFLGGEDFDNEFMKFIINYHEQLEGIKLDTKKISKEKLKHAAEAAKIELSTKSSTRIQISDIIPGQDIDLTVSSKQFENVVMKIANKTIEPCKKAMNDANIKKDDIKHVILVGGMTRLPLIKKLVEDIFGIKPLQDINPDEVVAKGAAIQGGVIGGTVDNVLLLDVIPLSLGIETLGGVFSKIIPRNTTIPFKQKDVFSTSQDNQTEVDISVYQGERPMVADNKLLGVVKLINIPLAPRGVPKIEVIFEADNNGILKVSAFDSLSKKAQEMILKPSSGLTEEEVKSLIKNAESKKNEDLIQKQKVEFRINSTEFIYKLRDRKEKLPENLEKSIKEFESFLQDDFDLIDAESKFEKLKKIV